MTPSPEYPQRDGVVSRHLLRRTARASERRLESRWPHMDFRVEPTTRGPFGWRVRRVR